MLPEDPGSILCHLLELYIALDFILIHLLYSFKIGY